MEKGDTYMKLKHKFESVTSLNLHTYPSLGREAHRVHAYPDTGGESEKGI